MRDTLEKLLHPVFLPAPEGLDTAETVMIDWHSLRNALAKARKYCRDSRYSKEDIEWALEGIESYVIDIVE